MKCSSGPPFLFALALALGACSSSHAGRTAMPRVVQRHSSPIVVSPDGGSLYVAHADADRITVIDTKTRAIVKEVALAGPTPVQDPVTLRYDPMASPRALALDPSGSVLFATGQRSGRVYSIDVATFAVTRSVEVCAEPVGVLVDGSGAHVFVACAQDDAVLELNGTTLRVEASVSCPRKPWTLAWGPDSTTLVVTHFLGPGFSIFDTSNKLSLTRTVSVEDGAPGMDPTEPHGAARGFYDAAVRPGTRELWLSHLMLGIDTPQPLLDFHRTVFPAISIFDGLEAEAARLTISTSPDDGNALGDVVSGPRAIDFSEDGKLAFVVDTDSEDVLVIDTETRVESGIVRPLPGHLPEGVVTSPHGRVYVYERNTEDIVALHVKPGAAGPSLVVDGAPIPTLASDPMPPVLRLGQKLFHSANSSDVPVTTDHWVACASCHLEGRSDAVTWKFAQGPRDTPSNAGGTRDTGFLFRVAARNQVQDYWKTINVEQGGHFALDSPAQKPLLDALAAYVDDAIPTPIPPHTDPAMRSAGEQVFERLGCPSCHAGPARTDSGAGNPSLDMAGQVLLHDVGTCVSTGPFPDAASEDKDGHPRGPCSYDTPALRGLTDSAPYYHDGSAATLDDVLDGPEAHTGAVATLTSDERAALIEFLRSL